MQNSPICVCCLFVVSAHADPVVTNHSSSNSTQPAAAAGPAVGDSTINGDSYIRCSCCQRGCHIKCLPQEQQQQLAAWAAAPQDSTLSDRDQNKGTPRGSKRIRSPRGKKQQSKQEQEQQQQQQEQERLNRPVPPYLCSPGCKQTAAELAKRCAAGAVQLDALPDGTPICWQLLQPAAVAAALAAAPHTPAAAADMSTDLAAACAAAAAQELAAEARSTLGDTFAGAVPPPAPVPAASLLGTGIAPVYTQQQAHVLAQVLRDTQQLMAVQLGPVWEVRTYQHCLPWLLSGLRQPTPGGGLLDLSNMHVAVLWIGSTLAAAALVRVHGGEAGGVLEVMLAATSPLLQHRRLGRMLVGAVERFAMESCKVKQAWMPALGGVVRPCVGVSVLPGWEREDGVRGRLQLAPGCSAKLLGLDVSSGSSAGGAAAGSNGQAAEDAAQKVPKGVASCWALKLSYGRAANVTDWLQLTKCPLLRYSYVPFVSKRLEAQTMLPLPHFRKQQPVRPPPLPPLPPQMQLQQRFGMPPMLPPPYHMQQRPMMPMQPMQPVMMQQPMQPVPMHEQQPGMPLAGLQAAAAGVLMPQEAAPGSAEVNHLQGPAGPAEVEGDATTAVELAAGAGSSSNQQQEGSNGQAGEGEAAAAGGGEAEQQHQQQEQRGPANPSPASKRQQWKEQVMQQFLAQQSGLGAVALGAKGQQADAQQGPAAAGDQAAGAGAGSDSGQQAAAADGPEPMQE